MSTNNINKTNQSTTKSAPKKPRQKTYNLKSLEKDYKQLSKLSTYVLNEETNEVIKYYEKFDEAKIHELLETAFSHLVYVREQNLPFFNSDFEFEQYLYYLIIYKFSTVVDESVVTFEDHQNVLSQLVSTGLFEFFFEFIFDGNEVMKILDKRDKMVNLVEKINSLEESTRNEILEKVQNKEVLNYNPNREVVE